MANRATALAKTPVSANGRWVAFISRASNLVRGDTNGEWDVFVRDARKESTRRVSVSRTGRQANDGSSLSSISGQRTVRGLHLSSDEPRAR